MADCLPSERTCSTRGLAHLYVPPSDAHIKHEVRFDFAQGRLSTTHVVALR